MRIQSFFLATVLSAGPALAQAPVAPAPISPSAPSAGTPSVLNSEGRLPICNGFQEVPPPVDPETKRPLLPPAGSGPVVYYMAVCFPTQGNVPLVEAQTYLYYMQSPDLLSMPSQNVWKPYNEAAEQTIITAAVAEELPRTINAAVFHVEPGSVQLRTVP